jgi:uracil-DNA glycosylase
MSIDLIALSKDRKLDSWRVVFDKVEPELEDIQDLINNKLRTNDPIFPNAEDIFSAFKETPLESVNVVIVGQDPYVDTVEGGLPRATGMSFSSRGKTIPPSLRNIFNEIHSEYDCDMFPENEENPGDLTYWTHQGVLLLNIALTVNKGHSNSHQGIWLGFITKVIEEIEKVNKNCIYVLWGLDAIGIEKKMNLKGKILKSSHPGPQSYNRKNRYAGAFEGNGHFKMINELLLEQNKEPIVWCKSVSKID